MRRKFLCGLALALCGPLSGTVLAAQPVPARDLWEFPLGAVLEPAAFAFDAGTGMWNPASLAMPAGTRLRFGVANLATAANQGVDAQLIGGAFRRASGTTIGLSIARAAVDGIVRTETEPTSAGSVTYSSFLISATIARKVIPHLTIGASARYRDGRTDQDLGSAIAGDVGFVVDSLPWHSARFGASSFLWRPGRERDDHPAFLAAADLRIFSNPNAPDIRAGYMRNVVSGATAEHGPFTSVRTGPLEVRGSLVLTRAFGNSNARARTGISLHFTKYIVGIGREEGASGLGPLYQFTLSSIVK